MSIDVCRTPPNIKHQTSNKPQTSNIKHQTNIKHRTSNIKHQTSNIKPKTSNIKHQTSNITHQTSNIKHQTSNINHQPSNIKHQTSNTHQTSNIKQTLSAPTSRCACTRFLCVSARSHPPDPASVKWRKCGPLNGLVAIFRGCCLSTQWLRYRLYINLHRMYCKRTFLSMQ